MAQPRELSIFVDESGVFGPVQKHSPFYVLSLVLHDQHKPISSEVDHIENMLVQRGYPRTHVIHTAPLIRREDNYRWIEISERRTLFRILTDFFRVTQVHHQTWVFDKRKHPDTDDLIGVMARTLGVFLRENATYFTSWDHIVVYYDNGQREITKIVNTSFSTLYSNVEVRRVRTTRYRLFQVADLCCTLSLIQHKMTTTGLSQSERDFFQTTQNSAERTLRKGYLKTLENSRFTA
jgi:hypothetical protein